MEQIGRFQILGELGRGAMGVVYRALDPTIGREVAIKTIRLSDFASPEQRAKQRERLFREARSAGILSHPGIVTIFDVGDQDDIAYIAMELVHGSTVDALLSFPEALEPERMFSFLRQTAVALDYAHRKGIVHRDIKPANLMVDLADHLKITDFGIAKITTSEGYTQLGLIMGTPNYMSPEQVQGKEVDGSADQYSLCVVAYEMLTGEKPFVAEQLATLVFQIVCEEPPLARRINPTLGAQVEAVLHKGLAKKPEARHPSCSAMIDTLEAACAATPGWRNLSRGSSRNLPTLAETAPLRIAVAPALPQPRGQTLPPPRTRGEPVRQKRGLPGALWVLLLFAVAGAIYYVVQMDVAPKQPAPAPAPALATAADPAPAPAPPPAIVYRDPAPPVVEPAPAPRPAPLPHIPASVEIPVASSPTGAHATLDGLAGTTCTTPCVLKAVRGEHVISLSLDGYRAVSRAVKVGDDPVNLPVLTMPVAAGIIMLQSQPPGATIFVDDLRWPDTTPAQLRITPGPHRITVEKQDARVTQNIEIRDGDIRHISIPLTQP